MTEQAPEILIVDGEECPLATTPSLPLDHPQLVDSGLVLISSGCWRGYRGTWQIEDDRLYLASISGKWKLLDGKPLLADWYSGTLRVPLRSLNFYEWEEARYEVERGVVVSRTEQKSAWNDPPDLF